MRFGLCIDSVVESTAYNFLAFEGTFLSIGLMMFLSVAVIAATISQTVNKTYRKKRDM
jgi:hypothetical protein